MSLELVPMTLNDLVFLLEVRNDESTRKNLENDSIFTIIECTEWFKNLKDTWYIILVQNEKVGYLRVNGNEIGCDIHPSHRRKGYAKRAYKKYLENKKNATLWVFEDNFAKKLYEDLGFVENGEEKIIRDRKYVRMIYDA